MGDLEETNKDYCTMWPERIGKVVLSDCCYQHDMDYWNPKKSFYEANRGLYECVKGRSQWIAIVMFLGVSTPIAYGIYRYHQWLVKTERI